MMIATESKLWDKLAGATAGRDELCFTRIEASTALGVADIEYVTPAMHGWIELKVSHALRASSPLRLSSPFTLHQYQWLMRHSVPRIALNSFLLIGQECEGRWSRWILVPAKHSAEFLEGRKAPRCTSNIMRNALADEEAVVKHLCGGME